MSDLSGVVNEQKATIETLRRQVAELEGERNTAVERYQNLAERHEPLIVKARKLNAALAVTVEGRESIINDFHLSENHASDLRNYSFEIGKLRVLNESLTAENAGLKRQVEALREDAEKIEDSKIPVKHLPTIITLAEKMIAWKRAEQDVFRPGSCEQECHRRQHAHELAIEIQDLTAVLEGTKALREAAKGEVEDEQD